MLAAVIPTIDEADTIGNLVRALDKVCDMVVVVDDSETTDTADAAIQAGGQVLYGYGSLGKAYCYGDGNVPNDDDWNIVHIDAGGSHDPEEVGPMFDLAADGFDCVIGSRFCVGGQHLGKWSRRFTSRAAAAALNLISLQDIADWTSGYRVYSPRARTVLAEHEFSTSGHAWQIEALWTLLQNGCRVVEHPIVYRPSASHLSGGRVREAIGLYWKLLAE